MITKLTLKNFTSFNDIELDFSPKINIIIGENGSGKTHILKAAYGLSSASSIFQTNSKVNKGQLEELLTTKLQRLFSPLDGKLGKMHRQGAVERATLEAEFAGGEKISTRFFHNSKSLAINENVNFDQYRSEVILIPTKEVLSLVRGITHREHDHKTVEMIFDDSYIDLASLLMKPGHDDPATKIDLDPRFGSIVPKLVNLIGGRYQWEDGEFYFQQGSYEEKADPSRSKSKHAQMYQDAVVTRFVPIKNPKYSSSMTAEGFKKIGVLHRLLANGSLNPGASGPLFWDEPESNLNPKLMKELVQVILELSRNGQQVVLATHDYVLLKWFDLLMDKGKGDHVRFHTMYRDENSGEVMVENKDDYSLIRKSAISDTFAELYDEDVKRALG